MFNWCMKTKKNLLFKKKKRLLVIPEYSFNLIKVLFSILKKKLNSMNAPSLYDLRPKYQVERY